MRVKAQCNFSMICLFTIQNKLGDNFSPRPRIIWMKCKIIAMPRVVKIGQTWFTPPVSASSGPRSRIMILESIFGTAISGSYNNWENLSECCKTGAETILSSYDCRATDGRHGHRYTLRWTVSSLQMPGPGADDRESCSRCEPGLSAVAAARVHWLMSCVHWPRTSGDIRDGQWPPSGDVSLMSWSPGGWCHDHMSLRPGVWGPSQWP